MIDNYRWQYGSNGAGYTDKITWNSNSVVNGKISKIAAVSLRHCIDLSSDYPIEFRKSEKRRGCPLEGSDVSGNPLYLDYEVKADGTQVIWWWTNSGEVTGNCGINVWDYYDFFQCEDSDSGERYNDAVNYCELINWYMGSSSLWIQGSSDTDIAVNLTGADFSDVDEVLFQDIGEVILGNNQWKDEVDVSFVNLNNRGNINLSNLNTSMDIDLEENNIRELNLDNSDTITSVSCDSYNHIDTIYQRNWNINSNSPSLISGSIDSYDVSNWTFDNDVSMGNIIGNYNIASSEVITGIDNWDVSEVRDFKDTFNLYTDEDYSLNVSNWDLSSARDVRDMFIVRNSDDDIIDLNCSNWYIPSNLMNSSKVYLDKNTYQEVSFTTDNVSNNNVRVNISNWNIRDNIDGLFANFNAVKLIGVTGLNISRINSMKSLFEDAKITDMGLENFRNWNVSHVTDMSHLFDDANFDNNSSIVPYISNYTNNAYTCNWNVGNVTDMSYMFARSSANISNDELAAFSDWDVSNVTDFSYMFDGAIDDSETPADLSVFDDWADIISPSANYSHIFGGLTDPDHAIFPNWNGTWIKSEGTFMPAGASATLPASSVTLLANALSGTSYAFTPLTLNSSTGQLEHYMFPGVNYPDSATTVNNTTNLTTTHLNYTESEFIYRATAIPTSTSMPLYVYHGYYYCQAPLSFSNTANFNAILAAVANCLDNGISFRGWDTSAVTDMHNAFRNTSLKWLDATGWNTTNVTDMSGMFENTTTLNDIFGLQTWNTPRVTNMRAMFSKAGSDVYPTGANPSTYHLMLWNNDQLISRTNISGWSVSNVTDFSYMFLESIVTIPTAWVSSRATNMSGLCENAISLEGAYGYDIYGSTHPTFGWYTSGVTNMSSMFKGNDYVFDLSSLDTLNVTNMSSMFENNIGEITNIGSWDVTNVTDMSNMFKGTKLGRTINLSNWVTSSVTNFTSMFEGGNFPVGVENFDIGSARTNGLARMFTNSKINANASYTWDFSGWDADMDCMNSLEYFFSGIIRDTGVSENLVFSITGFENWDTSNVTSMAYLFKDTKWGFRNVDMSNWDMSNVTNVTSMFEDSEMCRYHNELLVLTLPESYDYRDSSVTTTDMFDNAGFDVLEYNGFIIDNKSTFTSFINSLPVMGLYMKNVDCQITNISNLFSGVTQLRIIDFSGWDTSVVTNFDQLFYRGTSAAGGVLDFSSMDNWDISNGTSFVETCRSNLESLYYYASLATNGTCFSYEQGYTFPNWSLGNRAFNDTGIYRKYAYDMTSRQYLAYTFQDGQLNNIAPVGFGSFDEVVNTWDFTDSNINITQEASMGNYTSPSYYAWSMDGSNTPLRLDVATAPTIAATGIFTDIDFDNASGSGQYAYNPDNILSNYFYTSGYRIEMDLGVVDPTAIEEHAANYNTLLEEGVGYKDIDGGISFDDPTSPPEWYFARDTADEVELPDLQNKTIIIDITDGTTANTHNAKVYVSGRGVVAPVVDYTFSDNASWLADLNVYWKGGYYTTQYIKAIRIYQLDS